ncbi:MAG: serine--tRNA ligase, partial [Patescibacteria group bacterium]
MLDIKLIREQPDLVKTAAKNKRYDPGKVDEAIQLDERRRKLLLEIESLRSKRNGLTKDDLEKGKEIKTKLKALEPELKEVEEKLDIVMRQIP